MGRPPSCFKKVFCFIAFVFAFLWPEVNCACQVIDASWDNARGPLVTQPSKSDPAKVMLDWSNIITHKECVDEYYIWVWHKGTPRERGRKIIVPSKDSVSFIVEVEACVDYTFTVEFLEKNTLWANLQRESAQSHFRTEAIPQLKSRDKNLFTVGYFFDATKGLHDLSKVSIKFPKKILDHPNCIKHIEVRGNLDLNAQNPNFSVAGAVGQVAGTVTGQKGGKQGAPSVSNLANVTLQHGADLMYKDHHHELGWHGRPGHGPVAVGLSTTPDAPKKRTKRFLGKSTTTTTTTVKPRVGGPPPVVTQLTQLVTPPFLSETIEAIVDGVEACRPYIFTLKIVSPRSAIMGEVEGLKLPPLNQILDYHPPSLKSLFQIDMITTGQPQIRWQPGHGVPAACLPTFFDAVDLHMQRIEEEIIYHVNQEFNTNLHVKHFSEEMHKSQAVTLTQFGCKCNSSVIKLSSTDPMTLSKIPHLLGLYHYDHDHQGRPFYRMPSKHADREPDFLIPPFASTSPPHHPPHSPILPPHQPHGRSKRFIGKIPGSPTGSNTQNPYDSPPSYPPPPPPSTLRSTTANWYFPTPAPTIRPNPVFSPITPIGQPGSYPASPSPPPISAPMKVAFFLYWDPLEKNWLMSNILGGSLPWIKSVKNPAFICPADPGNAKMWSYEDQSSKTRPWVTDPTLKFECVF